MKINLQKFTREAGAMSYYEVCSLISQGWKKEWDLEQRVPYIYNGDQWISYDDVNSLTEKVFLFSYFIRLYFKTKKLQII